MKKNTSRFTASLIAALSISAPSFAEKISLDRLNEYINGLPVAKASFTQINADKSKSRGQLYLSRPGKMRFEYSGKNKDKVVVNNGTVAVYDGKFKDKPPSIFPLKRTPLSLILGNSVNLKTNGMVVKHVESGKYTYVIARDPKGKTKGQIQLVFTDNPVRLTQWIITDQSKQRTIVQLGKLAEQKKLSARLFEIQK